MLPPTPPQRGAFGGRKVISNTGGTDAARLSPKGGMDAANRGTTPPFGKENTMKRYYLAYGSNLNIRQMALRCPTAKPVGTAVIKDYELLFKGSKTGAYLTIEPKVGAEVPVAVWSVEPADEKRLDVYEGFPAFYYKAELELPVRYFSGKTVVRKAFVYIMHEERPLGLPSGSYVRTCLEGYSNFGFDESILLAALENSRKGQI